MKTTTVVRVIAAAILTGIFSSFSVYAASPATVSAQKIREKFVQAVMHPEEGIVIPSSGEAEVLFTLTDDGNVNITKLKASDDAVNKYVTDRITSVDCKDFVHPYGQHYKIKFKFTN